MWIFLAYFAALLSSLGKRCGRGCPYGVDGGQGDVCWSCADWRSVEVGVPVLRIICCNTEIFRYQDFMRKSLRFLLFFLALGAPASHVLAVGAGSADSAEDIEYDGPLTIKLGTRLDYQREYQKSDAVDDRSGFKGHNLMISIQGNITNRFSFRYRQRISESKRQSNFFDGTDFMYLKYRFNKRWDVTAGKNAIEFGSAEYQRDPSEQYFLSDYWNYPPCYKFAFNLGCNVGENDRLVLQAAESSFKTKENDVYAYALSWYGNHKWFHTMYSANMMEYVDGKYLYYISLGHTLEFGKVRVNVDYMNRFTGKEQFFEDCTVRGEVMYRPNDNFNFVALGFYSNNQSHDLGALYLAKGTELTHWGGVVEYSPIPEKDKTLKLHAAYSYYYGQQGMKEAALDLNRHFLSVGVQWEMDIVALAKKIWKKN